MNRHRRSERLRRLSIEPLEDRRLLAVLDLASSSFPFALPILGESAGDQFGKSVSGAGDVNGDGYDDFIIGAPYADGFNNFRPNGGETYVVFGSQNYRSVLNSFIDMSSGTNLNGSNGFKLMGARSSDYSGKSVSAAGDVNGDGFDDLLVSAPNSNSSLNNRSGLVYVILGKASWTPFIDLQARILPTYFIQEVDAGLGTSVSAVGDVDGDGLDDFVIGAPFQPPVLSASPGKAFLIFGRTNFEVTQSVDLSEAITNFLPTERITLLGIDSFDGTGNSVSGAGDVNGDGFGSPRRTELRR